MKASVLILGLSLIAGVAYGQSVVVKRSVQDGASTPYDNDYSRSSQVTVMGKIIGIGVSRPTPQMSNNVRFIVQTSGKKHTTYLVEVGPQWFVRSQTAHPKLGQWVRVTGSKISDHGETKILAMQVQLHNHDVLALRRITGIPYWVDLTPPATQDTVAPDAYTTEKTRLAAVGTILAVKTFTINGVQYSGYVVQTSTGPANVIVAPTAYTAPVQTFGLGDNVQVYSPGYYSPVVVLGGNAGRNPYIVSSAMYGGNGTAFIGPGVSYFPGYVPW